MKRTTSDAETEVRPATRRIPIATYVVIGERAVIQCVNLRGLLQARMPPSLVGTNGPSLSVGKGAASGGERGLRCPPLWSAFKNGSRHSIQPTPPLRQMMSEWQQRRREARAKKLPVPPRPAIITNPLQERYIPCNQFNTMIHPLIPMGVRGFVWYQGEGNVERAE